MLARRDPDTDPDTARGHVDRIAPDAVVAGVDLVIAVENIAMGRVFEPTCIDLVVTGVGVDVVVAARDVERGRVGEPTVGVDVIAAGAADDVVVAAGDVADRRAGTRPAVAPDAVRAAAERREASTIAPPLARSLAAQ